MNKSLFLFLIFSIHILQAQNLVVDGGFENTFQTETNEKGNMGYTNSFLKNWFEISSKNVKFPYPNYKYAIDSVAQSDERYRIGNYYIRPQEGESYTKIHYTNSSRATSHFHTSIFVGNLKQLMTQGKLYEVGMQVAGEREIAIVSTGMGIAFVDDTVGIMENEFVQKLKVAIISNDFVSDSKWQSIEGNYLATGKEKYIVIGYLIPPNQRKYQILQHYFFTKNIAKIGKEIGWSIMKDHPFGAGFCVDNVFVNESATQFADEELEDSLPKTETFLLKNIEFETGKATLTESSIPYLNKLLDFLKANPAKEIQIIGHTDATGDEKENLLLSQARARSVATYLQTNGISPTKISTSGKGESKPLTENNSEEGRRTNRRVEIRFFD